jgi:hypothetical protein
MMYIDKPGGPKCCLISVRVIQCIMGLCQYTSLLVLCAGCMYSKLYLPLVSSENIVNLTDQLFLDLRVGMR